MKRDSIMKALSNFFQGFSASAVKQTVVGIDVGSASIKVVQLEEQKGVLTLTTYGEIQLGPFAGKSVGESVTLTPHQEQEALVDVFRESAITAKRAVFAVPLSASFVTSAIIDAGQNSDISAMVRVEARKVIPASLTELTLDWAEVASGETKSVETEVLIAAIQNSALSRFKTLMQFVNLPETPSEIECFSTIRALHTQSDDHLGIIDIGASTTKLYIVKKGILVRMHRTRVGGDVVTRKIASMQEVDFQEAEIRKREVGSGSVSDKDSLDIKRVHDSVYERPFRELAQVIREYEEKNGVELDKIYLTGGATLFSGIEQLLKTLLGREITKTNAFTKVSYPAFMQDTIASIAPSFSVALGAALRSFE
jgi:type IV pilus assembly protein PilM